jgi:rhodanese-related sulfurtransferase
MTTTISQQTLTEITPLTLKQRLKKEKITLVDVREPGEYATGHIPGAILIPLSTLEPTKIPENGNLILYCRSGNRSRLAAQQLLANGFDHLTHLQGGIMAWQEANYPVKTAKNAPISIMRQVQLLTGLFIVIGSLLGAFVSPWWFILSTLIGVSLIVAGLTQTCTMRLLLQKLPYNQKA